LILCVWGLGWGRAGGGSQQKRRHQIICLDAWLIKMQIYGRHHQLGTYTCSAWRVVTRPDSVSLKVLRGYQDDLFRGPLRPVLPQRPELPSEQLVLGEDRPQLPCKLAVWDCRGTVQCWTCGILVTYWVDCSNNHAGYLEGLM
jgi:hypothetical protein